MFCRAEEDRRAILRGEVGRTKGGKLRHGVNKGLAGRPPAPASLAPAVPLVMGVLGKIRAVRRRSP